MAQIKRNCILCGKEYKGRWTYKTCKRCKLKIIKLNRIRTNPKKKAIRHD